MDAENEHKKRPYKPPKIYELEVDLTQAMGQTQCSAGRGASGACSRGNLPAGSGCGAGGSASVLCGNGQRPGATCSRGSNPGM
ncbi:MAG: hypothetical protein JRF53_12640 [Deltaproteobacteria bacterium]|nr:hypothetical protein [Deltaproteobacteria bacterium]